MELVAEKYKQTEVGLIPSDWNLKKIGEFTDVHAGGTPSTKVKEFWNGEIRWMNSGELNLKKVYEVENRITELGLSNSATKLIPQNCILIGLAGQGKTRGTVAINKVELCTNQSIAAIFPCEIVDCNYLYFNLDARYYELRGLSTGDGGRGGLNLYIIKNLSIPLPPTKVEQTAIATALSDADALIKYLEKLIDKKEKIKQGSMQKLLTPKKDWVLKKLGEIAEFKNGKAHEQFIDERGDYIVINSKFISTDGAVYKNSNIAFSPLRKGEIAMVMSDIPNGKALAKCFLVKEDNKYTLNQRICSLKSELCDNDFLYLILNRNEYFLAFDSGAGQTNLRRQDVLECPVPSPPNIEEQKKIAAILNDMDSEITTLEKKLDKYKMIKQGMMQNLLTGKIRLV